MSERSVLISIQPKWCKKIANCEKPIEVRKTRPKLETPFKVYIYCTRPYTGSTDDNFYIYPNDKPRKVNGYVIGEFICDRIEEFYCASVPYQRENNLGYGHFVDNGVYKVNGWHEGVVFERNDRYIDTMLKNKELDEMCLSAQEIFDYIGIGKYLYGWHISDLVIYDKPKELGEFKRFVDRSRGKIYFEDMLILTRPPQSWCYVEPLKENADD